MNGLGGLGRSVTGPSSSEMCLLVSLAASFSSTSTFGTASTPEKSCSADEIYHDRVDTVKLTA